MRTVACGALKQVIGSGEAMALTHGSGDTELTVVGAWRSLQLTDSKTSKLSAPAALEVQLTLCPQLRQVALLTGSRLLVAYAPELASVSGPARVAYDPRAAMGALREASTRDPALREAMFNDVAHVRGANQTLRALQVLAELARAGVDPERVWGVRMNLLQRHRSDRWLWQLPQDLADDGWSADVRLWLYCHPQVAHARQWQSGFEREFQPEHLEIGRAHG